MNIRSMVITGTVMLILFGGFQVFASQTNQPQQQGHWQMFVNNGGDGATAWKFNPETGESYYCHRTNCFASQNSVVPRN
jgi:hypothetical protein